MMRISHLCCKPSEKKTYQSISPRNCLYLPSVVLIYQPFKNVLYMNVHLVRTSFTSLINLRESSNQNYGKVLHSIHLKTGKRHSIIVSENCRSTRLIVLTLGCRKYERKIKSKQNHHNSLTDLRWEDAALSWVTQCLLSRYVRLT